MQDPQTSVANLAFFPQHWACFDADLRDFFVSCGLHIFGLVLMTLAGFWAYVIFFLRFFTCDSIYAIVRICHRNSVCPSVCHTGGSVKSS